MRDLKYLKDKYYKKNRYSENDKIGDRFNYIKWLAITNILNSLGSSFTDIEDFLQNKEYHLTFEHAGENTD